MREVTIEFLIVWISTSKNGLATINNCRYKLIDKYGKDNVRIEVNKLKLKTNLEIGDIAKELYSILDADAINGVALIDADKKYMLSDIMGGQAKEKSKGVVLDQVMQLYGCKDLKDYTKEIFQVGPLLIENKTVKTVLSRPILMAMEDGFLAAEYISYITNLYKEVFGMDVNTSSYTPIDLRIKEKAEDYQMFFQILDSFEYPVGEEIVNIACINLTEVLGVLNEKWFKDFLQKIRMCQRNSLFFFVVPYLNDSALNDIIAKLFDVFNIVTLKFPALSMEELQDYANGVITNAGFEMDSKAWDIFKMCIKSEKNDGKFYGTKTAEKIVYSILYTKQKKSAIAGTNDKKIFEADINCLVNETINRSLSGIEQLERLVGMDNVKDQVKKMIIQIKKAKEKKREIPCMHMCFTGNPGTGKTTVARIIGQILSEEGILRKGGFEEKTGRDFCGKYIGHTAPKTLEICARSYGSILFIDEAYSLYQKGESERDFGKEVISTLITEMENHRDDLIIIFAGYKKEMDDFLESNSGLKSRIPYIINFDNYSPSQLTDMFYNLITDKCDSLVKQRIKEYFDNIPTDYLNSSDFSNGRFVRNLYQRMWAHAAFRASENGEEDIIKVQDFENAINEPEFRLEKEESHFGF